MKSLLNIVTAMLALLSINLCAANTATYCTQERDELAPVIEKYFEIKNALVKTDGKSASAKAKELTAAIKNVQMDKLTAGQHTIWMAVKSGLAEDAEHISDTGDAKHQRDHFVTLSTAIYKLQKVSKTAVPVYYQFCPMANGGKGANWLSKEKAVKNPYYGSQMLSCGKTVETIQ
jgi:septum formation topological specificity factor MinE